MLIYDWEDVRLVLLHNFKNDDAIKQFFTECHELFIKVLNV